MNKAPDYYRSLPYTRRVRLEEDRPGEVYFVAYIEEIPSVEAGGDSPVDALHHLQDAFEDYVEAAIEFGTTIPEPKAWLESFGIEAADQPPGRVTVQQIKQVGVGPPQAPEWMPELEIKSEGQRPTTAGV